MIIGDVFLWLAALCLAAAFVSYLSPPPRGGGPRVVSRWLYIVSAVALTGAVAVLLTALLGHRFDVEYVFSYTSRDLPIGYVISALWAGSEGSFLLWAFLGGWAGVLVARTSRELEAQTMLFWCLAQGILVIMLLNKSPFVSVPAGTPITDGQGLNPILQDPWMAIHPPVLFLGFVAMSVPACLAAGSLLAGKYDSWSKISLPWATFGWLTLGAGLTLGGLWAYEVLGWGGYWGWDPVENSSLVPWITGTILLHGLILQKRKGTSIRVNYIFALVTYILVLYSTFLTRSGVLGDFSVHSFSDLGVTEILASLIILAAVVFIGLLAWRFTKIPAPDIVENPDGKELNLYINTWLLTGIAVLVLIGTSAPLITKIFDPKHPSGVQPHFYNSTAGPLAVVVLVLLAFAPLMAWSVRAKRDAPAPKSARWIGPAILGAAIVSIVLLMMFGTSQGTLLDLGLMGLIALVVNAIWFFRITSSGGVLLSSPFFAHAGFALMFVGIAGSNLGGPAVPLQLTQGQSGTALNWKITLDKVFQESPQVVRADFTLTNPGGAVSNVSLQGTQMPGGGLAYRPFIQRGPLSDTYFAPDQISVPGSVQPPKPQVQPLAGSEQLLPVVIATGTGKMTPEPVTTKDGKLTVALTGMEVEAQEIQLTVQPKGSSESTITLQRGEVKRVDGFDIQFQDFGPMEQTKDGATRVAAVVNVAPATGATTPASQIYPGKAPSHGAGGPQVASVSLRVSTKPLMGILWLGAVLAGIGGLMAVVRRFTDMALERVPAPAPSRKR